MNPELRHKIQREEIDVNNMTSFFSIVLKGLIYNLNHQIFLHNSSIPHYILNTGDDIVYLEVKGQDASIEPVEVSNEKYVYSQVPRCVVNPGGISLLPDQLTNPYTRGYFDLEYDGTITKFAAEYRRMPMHISATLKYYLDNFTDSLLTTQQLISKLTFIRNYNIVYMGQNITCSYKMPDSENIDTNIEFDGGTTDQKNRTVEIELEVEANYPIFNNRTAIEADAIITKDSHILQVIASAERDEDGNIVSSASEVIKKIDD